MTVKYYSTTDTEHPPIIIALMEAIRYYYCTLLYPNEAYADSKSRFVRADISDNALRQNADIFNVTNQDFPFTAFSYGDVELNTDVYAKYPDTGNFYCDDIQASIEMKPMKLEIPMISFFTTGWDYFYANSLLQNMKTDKIKLTVPIEINGVTTTFPAIMKIEDLSKGSYAWEFAEQLSKGKIQDLSHTTYVYYYDLIVDGIIYPVDDIEFALEQYAETYKDSLQADFKMMPDTPIISSTDPADGTENVLVDYGITINFSESMYDSTVEDAIDFTPWITADYIWNSDYTSLIINPGLDMASGTTYTIEISTDALSGEHIPIEEDYEFSFTTDG